ncbi:MAG: carbon-phosphorus lyase complex subunit PhnI [Egibacteraceae bacterium]
MGYAAVKGGLEAVLAAEDLVRRLRVTDESRWLEDDQVGGRLRLAVDRVQGEGGLWAPRLAAAAIRQAEGDLIEAAQLVRSYRSTLPRLAYTPPVDADEIQVARRVVPAYRTPPGPQLLGRTLDYTGRLIDFSPEAAQRAAVRSNGTTAAPAAADPNGDARQPRRLLHLLRERDLLVERREDADPDPFDITRRPVTVPAPRSARLAVLALGETGALVNLWYQGIRGPKAHVHELTLGEVRTGTLPVRVTHPRTGRPVIVGRVGVTEIEAIDDIRDGDPARFDAGYGLVLGHNERKAIAMAALDVAIERDRGRSPLEQSVLQTCDGLDASGFLEHLKLPHYVTFRSMVERKEAVRAAEAQA